MIKEWHPTKNIDLKLEDLARFSRKKVWWKCDKGEDHEWEATIEKRSIGRGCPFCSGRRPSKENNLLIKHPKVAEEWHPKKNRDLKPQDFTPGSKRKVWWKCKKGEDHEWDAVISNRTWHKSGCPFCSGRVITEDINLKNLFPNLCKEIHITKNKNINPKLLHPGSNKTIWWKCKKGEDHEWQAKIVSRTRGTNCPFCSGNKVSTTNNLTNLYPKIAKEWHPTKNGDLKPQEFTYGSKKMIWWVCQNGHEYKQAIGERSRGKGCPLCTHQTSRNEMRLMAELNYIFDEIYSRYRFKKTEIDIYLPSLKIGIEHDGSYWHRNKDSLDRRKNKILNQNEIILIRIRHAPLKKIEKHDIILEQVQFVLKNNIDDLLKTFLKLRSKSINKDLEKKIKNYLDKSNFVNEKLYKKYLSYAPSPLPQNSALASAPHLEKEWHPTKNYPLNLENFSRGVAHKAWWKCRNGHEWKAQIASRIGLKSGCPYCLNRKVNEENNLKNRYPEIAKEWHPTKNGNLKPEDVTFRSRTKVWWKCKLGHEWENTVDSRSSKGKFRQCLQCYNHNRKTGVKN